MERTRHPRDSRGVSLVLLAISLFVLMGMAALAVDLAMLQKARGEAQRAADAAALAGASAYLMDLTVAAETTEAGHRARQVVDTNYMNGAKFDSLAELTVWAIPDSQKIRVRVRRAAVPTWFARIFGVGAVAVGARAAAVADYSTGTTCVKPIAVPDLWLDAGDANGNKRYDPGETWLYNGAPVPDTYNPAHYAGDGTGTGLGSDLRNTYPYERDWGLRVVLRPSVSAGDPVQPCPGTLQGNKCYSPGFWGMWGSNQNKDLTDWITGCNMAAVQVDSTVGVTSGWRAGLGKKAVEDAYNADPGAIWDPSATDSATGKTGTVTGSTYGNHWQQSSRVWILAIMPPDEVPVVPSDNDTKFNNFMLFFYEGCIDETGIGPITAACGNKDMMLGRFVGLAKGTLTGPSPGTMVRILRLVE